MYTHSDASGDYATSDDSSGDSSGERYEESSGGNDLSGDGYAVLEQSGGDEMSGDERPEMNDTPTNDVDLNTDARLDGSSDDDRTSSEPPHLVKSPLDEESLANNADKIEQLRRRMGAMAAELNRRRLHSETESTDNVANDERLSNEHSPNQYNANEYRDRNLAINEMSDDVTDDDDEAADDDNYDVLLSSADDVADKDSGNEVSRAERIGSQSYRRVHVARSRRSVDRGSSVHLSRTNRMV